MSKKKKPKHTKEYYMKRKRFLSSCTDAFGVMCVIAFIMILTGTFDRLFPFGVRGTLCIIAKWTYYKKAVQAREWSKKELSDSSGE